MRCKIVNIDKEKGIVIHEYIDQIYLKAQISRSFDINCKAYDKNNEIGMFDRKAITLDDIYNHITKVRSRQAVKPPAVQPVVMTTGTLACLFLGRKMKKKKIFILCISFFAFLLSANEIIYKVQTPRINNKEVENIQKSLFKINLLPEKEIDGWYGPVTEKAVKGLQKIIGVKETGEVNSELYNFLTNETFSEIIKIDKIEKHETFEKVLDGSGYIFEAYYENTEIKKIIKKYWVAYAPNYEREEQYSETIYYLNNQYVQKWIQDSDAKWIFNLEEKKAKSLKKTVLTLMEE